jgi:hypothetical protein
MPSLRLPAASNAAMLPVVLLLLTAGALPSCGSMERNKQTSALADSTNAYREALRWGYWQAAAELLHPEAQQDLDLASLQNVRVTGIELVRPAAITPQNRVIRLVQIQYVLEDEQRVKQIMDRQDWRWDDARKGWVLHSGLPDF